MKHFLERLIKVVIGIGLILFALFLIGLEKDRTDLGIYTQENYASCDLYNITRFDKEERTGGDFSSIVISEVNEINNGGNYILTGESVTPFIIDVEEQLVHIVLDGISIRTEEEYALHVKSAGKVVITLADGSQNMIVCEGKTQGEDNMKGAIHAECDLTINGSGNLHIYSYAKDAIYSKDVIKILDGNYEIFGARDGIRCNDGIIIDGGNIEIQGNKCGLRTTKNTTGDIIISGGNVTCVSRGYGIYSSKDLVVKDCTFLSYGTIAMTFAEGQEQIEVECWRKFENEDSMKYIFGMQ